MNNMDMIPKPWGYEIWLSVDKAHAEKKLHINAGHRTSLQYHKFKNEVLFIKRGKVRCIKLGDSEPFIQIFTERSKMFVNRGTIHRFEAIEDTDIYELSTVELEDVMRLHDDYREVPTVIAVSGGFDPLHIGHMQMFEYAKKLGDILVVIINNDEFLIRKKGKAYQCYAERKAAVLARLEPDIAIVSIDEDDSVCRTLKLLRPAIFANGGDRKTPEGILEKETCERCGIKMVFGVGGGKIESSSRLNKMRSK